MYLCCILARFHIKSFFFVVDILQTVSKNITTTILKMISRKMDIVCLVVFKLYCITNYVMNNSFFGVKTALFILCFSIFSNLMLNEILFVEFSYYKLYICGHGNCYDN